MTAPDKDPPASHALLSAALGGLLCLASSACSSASQSPTGAQSPPPPVTESDGAVTTLSATFECDGGVSPNPGVTSTTTVALTQDEFTSQCQTKSGVVEIQPECGGHNACRGMSYDTATQTLTEHSCRFTNTCAGFTCIICD